MLIYLITEQLILTIWKVRTLFTFIKLPNDEQQPHIQVPGLLHVLPHHVFSHAVEHAGTYRSVRGAQTGFPQEVYQPFGVFAVKLTELRRPTVRLPPCDAVGPVKLLVNRVMVKLQVKRDRENIASQTAETLSQQEHPINHPGQFQVLLGVWATDAAVVERQLSCRVDGHGQAVREELDFGFEFWLLEIN